MINTYDTADGSAVDNNFSITVTFASVVGNGICVIGNDAACAVYRKSRTAEKSNCVRFAVNFGIRQNNFRILNVDSVSKSLCLQRTAYKLNHITGACVVGKPNCVVTVCVNCHVDFFKGNFTVFNNVLRINNTCGSIDCAVLYSHFDTMCIAQRKHDFSGSDCLAVQI